MEHPADTHTQRVLDLARQKGLLRASDLEWRTRKASADDLWRYAKVYRVANVMRPYMEVVAHE